MRNPRRLLVALFGALALALSLGASASASALSSFDGIADQHLGDQPAWSGNLDNSAFDVPISALFADTWVGSGHIKYARMITAWDAALQGGSCLANTEQFYNSALAQGVTPVLSFWGSYATGCKMDGYPPSAAAYSAALSKMLHALHDASPTPHEWPTVLEAWNEPNTANPDPDRVRFTATIAASYWIAANALCQPIGCTVVAGDYSDSLNAGSTGPSGPVTDSGPTRCSAGAISAASFTTVEAQESAYIAALGAAGAHPLAWGLHPYAEGYCHLSTVVNNLTSQLTTPTGPAPQLWLTELGAFVCDPNPGFFISQSVDDQNADAQWMQSTLLTQPDVAHAFYYQFAPTYDAPINVSGCGTKDFQDTALYAAVSANGPVQARPAAATIFGTDTLKSAAAEASAVTDTAANLSATITPTNANDTAYYFEYGTTPQYGSQTALLTGADPVATLSDLQAGSAYYYRLVVTDALGNTVYGPRQTLHTSGPISLFAGASQSVDWCLGGLAGWQSYGCSA